MALDDFIPVLGIPRIAPELDAGFLPAAVWHRDYGRRLAASGGARHVELALLRPDGTCFRHRLEMFPADGRHDILNRKLLDRVVKFLLWQKGGNRILLAGCDDLVAGLAASYHGGGRRAFDADLMGRKVFLAPFSVAACRAADLPPECSHSVTLGGHLDGCRIGFDLGGSDRKCAAVIDGKVVFSAEVEWSPYFEADPEYHYQGILDSLRRAAGHLPRVDAIGGSAAGVYIDSEPRVASLFRGVSEADFERRVRGIFKRVAASWPGVPFDVANDGEVSALAGAMALGDGALLGLAMGTSEAVGYCDPAGRITSWLNELAFAPIDYRDDAPADEWSGDIGCGVSYLSQQAVARLLPVAGIGLPADMPFPEQLAEAQRLVENGDERAVAVFTSVGVYLGYALAHYAEFYELRHVSLLGRVVSGKGGDLALAKAKEVLAADFPELAGLDLSMPDEVTRRHGQAIAAASLPARH